MATTEEIKQFVLDIFNLKFVNKFYYEDFDGDTYLIIVNNEACDSTFYSEEFQDFVTYVELFILQPNNLSVRFAREN